LASPTSPCANLFCTIASIITFVCLAFSKTPEGQLLAWCGVTFIAGKE
jgi:hypothetical protein